MAIISKQKNWSVEANLLYEILKEIDKLEGVISNSGGGGGSYTASNGITLTGSDFTLGGTLSELVPTVIGNTTSSSLIFDPQGDIVGLESATLFSGDYNVYDNYSYVSVNGTSTEREAYIISSYNNSYTSIFQQSNNTAATISLSTTNDFSNFASIQIVSDATGDRITTQGRLIPSPTATVSGLSFGSFAGNPSTLVNGDVWYNSTTNKFRGREGGSSFNFVTATPENFDISSSNRNSLVTTGGFVNTEIRQFDGDIILFTDSANRLVIGGAGDMALNVTSLIIEYTGSGFRGNPGDLLTSDGLNATWQPIGVINVVSPTAPNRTLAVNINGTTYYLAAKTTND